MKKYWFSTIIATVALFTQLSCSGESNNMLSTDQSQFNVKYEVLLKTQGAVKITHKNHNGETIVDDRVTADWQRSYTFSDRVAAMLEVEGLEAGSANTVTAELAIYVDGQRRQKATALLRQGQKSTLETNHP